MDRKSIIILVACFALLFSWTKLSGPLLNKYFPPVPGPTNSLATATNTVTGSNAVSARSTTAPTLTAAPAVAALPKPSPTEQKLVVTRDEVRYTFSSHLGGIKLIELLGYPETTDYRGKNTNAAPASLNTSAPVPAMSLLGGDVVQGDGVFTLSQPTPTSVRAEKALPNGLVIVKDFQFVTNFQFTTKVHLENRSDKPIALPAQELVFGTATPMDAHDTGMAVGIHHYNGSDDAFVAEQYFANRTLGCFPGTPRNEFLSQGTNVVWSAVQNQFFTMIAQPKGGAPQIISRKVDLPPPSAAEIARDSKVVHQPIGFQTAFLYPATVLEPKQSVERNYEVFAGPKGYSTLARLGDRRDLVMNFGFFGFFAKALLLSMNALYKLGISYGWAIVVITVIIKLVFWPLTQASTRSMKRMQALQPQMNALKEKYKDDPKKMNVKLMEFMKENKVSPLGGCLPMAIQMPVFFGFYTMLQSAIELRGAEFLWNTDLSKPDTLFMIPGINYPFNLFPLLMGATMLWQARMTPPSPGMDPAQAKMMKYMPLIFLVFLYNFSAGLTLYWTVQNLLTIAQMKLTKTAPANAAPVVAPTKKKN